MKYLAFALVFLVCFVSCNNPEQKPVADKVAAKSLNASNNSDEFNEAMTNLLNAYDSVKSALVDYDTARANSAALLVSTYLDSLPITAFPNDSAQTVSKSARDFAVSMKTAAVKLMTEKALEGKKRRFEGMSDAFYELSKTVRYDRQVLYHQHCPMAFNGEEEAHWVSTSPAIVNPYLGKKHPKYKDAMLACGDVTDSLDFAR